MGREIRVTVDDDEVFERMKTRKRELDLSWREVLHRGLWADRGGQAAEYGSHGHGNVGDIDPRDEDFGDRIERQIKRRVEDSIRSAIGADGPGGHGPGREPAPGAPPAPAPPAESYESDVEDLENAENAVLRFPFLSEEGPRYRVPLRVNLRTSADGLDVEVVAVRKGKSVDGTNAFDRSARMGIAQGFSRGARATLELGDGAERYSVTASLSWSRDDEGRPTVSDVTIEEVVFDDEQ